VYTVIAISTWAVAEILFSFYLKIFYVAVNSLMTVTMSFSSDEVNFLVYRYLQESGEIILAKTECIDDSV
jgi:hypothetical protein